MLCVLFLLFGLFKHISTGDGVDVFRLGQAKREYQLMAVPSHSSFVRKSGLSCGSIAPK